MAGGSRELLRGLDEVDRAKTENWWVTLGPEIQAEFTQCWDERNDDTALHGISSDGNIEWHPLPLSASSCRNPTQGNRRSRSRRCSFARGKGIDAAADLVDFAQFSGVIEKNGSHLSFDGEQLGQGRERAREMLLSRTELADLVRMKTLQAQGRPATQATA